VRNAAQGGITTRATAELTYDWTGSDEFSHLEDRKIENPLPLPMLKSPKRIVLVRHGQSTWNAEGRIQGSTDFAVLSEKGQGQARATRDMVLPCRSWSCKRVF
jgi:2-carboxy-D-arabinitol-1-phosphatase